MSEKKKKKKQLENAKKGDISKSNYLAVDYYQLMCMHGYLYTYFYDIMPRPSFVKLNTT